MQDILQTIGQVQKQLDKAIHLIIQIEEKVKGISKQTAKISNPIRVKVKSAQPTTNLSTTEKFNILSKTSAGRFILDLEEKELSYFLKYKSFQELYLARINFNTGQASGIELFKQYMPKRNALSGALLDSYDEQFQRIYYHVLANSSFTELKGKPEPSLVFLITIAIAESIAEAPHLVEEVLSKVSEGYFISLKEFNTKNPVMSPTPDKIHVSLKWMRVDFNLKSFLTSFIIPGDSDKFMNHKLSFFLDPFDKSKELEAVPNYMNHKDAASLVQIRASLLINYKMHGIIPVNWEKSMVNDVNDFWSEISNCFLSGRRGAQKIANQSKELYGILSRHYARRYHRLQSL